MGGRHAGDKDLGARGGLKYAVGAVALVVAVAVVGVLVARHDDPSASAGCGSDVVVRVAVAPEAEDLVAAAARRVDRGSCLAYDVVGEPPALTAQSVAIGDGAPELWVPDSSVWVSRVSSQLVEGVAAPKTVVRSIASTPVVLAWPKSDGPHPSSWLSVLTSATFTAGDPLATATAAGPLLAAYAEAARGVSPTTFNTVSAAQVRLAQRQSGNPPPTDPAALLAAVAKSGGSTVVSEQAFNAWSESSAAFDPVLPTSASLALGYPLVAVSGDSEHDEAAEALGDALMSKPSQAAFTKAGFRSPLGEPLESGRSVGDFEAMSLSDDAIVADTIKRWSLIAMPARSLAVIDVSKQMKARAGGSTKMALTVQAALKGLGLMPDSWALGTWVFSEKLDGKKDWKALASMQRLDAKDGAGTQRQKVTRVIQSLPKRVGGRTGLYDVTLAAYREVQASYDPKTVNSVIILTGGGNDDPGSISQGELVAALQRERDPARPVVVVAIGITQDADGFALQKIATASGGQVYLAREPDEIVDVFINALQSRY